MARKKAAATPAAGNGREEMRVCLVQLGDGERAALGREMATEEIKAESLKVERSALSKRIRDHDSARNRYAHELETGQREIELQCRWQPDYDAREWHLLRPDTGESIDVRPMLGEDLNHDLPFDAPGGPGADAAVAPVVALVPLEPVVELEAVPLAADAGDTHTDHPSDGGEPAPLVSAPQSPVGEAADARAVVVPLARPPRRPAGESHTPGKPGKAHKPGKHQNGRKRTPTTPPTAV